MSAWRRSPDPPSEWVYDNALDIIAHDGEDCQECLHWLEHYRICRVREQDTASFGTAQQARKSAIGDLPVAYDNM
jgi:hypothetical protein